MSSSWSHSCIEAHDRGSVRCANVQAINKISHNAMLKSHDSGGVTCHADDAACQEVPAVYLVSES